MTYAEALHALGSARRFGMKLGLDPMRRLAAALGGPQHRLRFLHIAGTNGKGSTAAFCEACLRAAGFQVGLYTSPHLVSVRERIQIDRELISESDFALGLETVLTAAALDAEPASTFFELMTGLALWYFERARVDWVVWETGLGGRLDATNIVTPEVTIITNIGLEHRQYLGSTLAEIAAEKAGIIKPGVPLITAVAEGEARTVILCQAQRKMCPVSLVNGANPPRDLGLFRGRHRAEIWAGHKHHRFDLGLLGRHQIENAACAIAALNEIPWEKETGLPESRRKRIELPILQAGLAHTAWPGRFQIVAERPPIVLDGAHNAAGLQCLAEAWGAFLAARFSPVPPAGTHLVFACAADKDCAEMAQILRPLARRVSLVTLAHERGAAPAVVAPAFAGLPVQIHSGVGALWDQIRHGPVDEPVLVTGSLFLIGEMLARSQGHAEEYLLNENLAPSATR